MRISTYTVGSQPGLQYKIDFGKREEGDHVVPALGIEVYVEDERMKRMSDRTLDHVEGRGFWFRRG